MAQDLGNLKIKIVADGASSVVTNMDEIDKAVDSTARKTRTATEQMVDSHNRMSGSATSASGLMEDAWKRLQGVIGAIGFGVLIKSALDAAMAMERLNSVFKATEGSAALAKRELAFVREESERLGLAFQDAAAAYGKFIASTKNTSIEGNTTRKVFSGVSEAVAALGLTTDQSNGIFLALSQMMSKGRVQAEELTGQLGERLPGALKLAADGMNMTTVQLLKQMQEGKIMSADLLPKLAEQLHKTYGTSAVEAADKGQASINRFKNALFDTKEALGTALMPTFTSLLNNVLKPLSEYITMFIGGLEILAVKFASLPDKAVAAWNVIKSGEGLFSTKGLEMYSKELTRIHTQEDAVIADIMRKYTQVSSAKSAAEIAMENDRNSRRRKTESPADKTSITDHSSEINAIISEYNRLEEEIIKTGQSTTELWNSLTLLEFQNKKTADSFLDAYSGSAQARAEFDKQGITLAKINDLYIQLQENVIIKADNKAYWDGLNKSWHEGKKEIDEVEQAIKRVFELGKKGDDGPLHAFAEDVRKATLAFTQAGNSFGVTAKAYVSSIEGAYEKLIGMKLSDITGRTDDLNNSMIEDPYARRQAEIDATYNREKKLIQEKIDLLKGASDSEVAQIASRQALIEEGIKREFELRGGPELEAYQSREKALDNEKWAELISNARTGTEHITALQKLLATLETKHAKDTADVDKDSFKSRLSMASQYTGMAGQLFSELASTQDQSARAGFETAKAFSLGAAIMSTAAGIMSAFAAPDNVTMVQKVIAAAMVGVTGALNIAKIASTSFGGGASGGFSVPSGSFGGGGSGGSTGLGNLSTPMSSIQDSQTNDSFDRLTASTDNVAVAIGRLSKGIDSLTALFEKGGAGFNLATNAPGISTTLAPLLGSNMMNAAGFGDSMKQFFKGNIAGSLSSINDSVFGGSWRTTGSGISLEVKAGVIAARDYLVREKDGGLFGSDQKSTTYTDNPEAARFMAGLVAPYIGELTRMARTLGTSYDPTAYTATAANIATAGRKPEDIAKDLEAWTLKQLQGMSLTVAGLKNVVGAYDDAYAKLLLYNDAMVSTNDALALIGKTQLYGSLKTAEWLSNMQETLFGGMNGFTEAIDTYFTSMFDDAQQSAMKAAQAQQQVNNVFNEMGSTVPATKAEFIQLVNGLDITSESGAKTFHALMNVSEAFGTVQDQAKKLADDLADLLKNGLDYSVNLLSKALEASTANLRAVLDIAKNATSQLIALKGGNSSPEQNYLQLKAAFTAAIAGNDSATILRIASQYNAASKSYNASGSNYQSDYSQIEQALAGLTGMPDTADLSLDALNRHTTYLDSIDKTISGQSALMSVNNGALADLNALFAVYVNDQQALKSANQLAYDSRAGSAAAALSAINGAGSVASLAGVINQMVTGPPGSNPFGFDSTMVNLAKNVAEGKNSQSELTTAMNSVINPYFSDYLKAGVVGSIPTVSAPTTNIAQSELAAQQQLYQNEKTKTQLEIDKIMAADAARKAALANTVGTNGKIITDFIAGGYEAGWFMNNKDTQGAARGVANWNAFTAQYQIDKAALASFQNTDISALMAKLNAPAPTGYQWSFDTGSPYIPYDMTAQIHQGEIIMDRASSDVLRKYGIPTSGSADNKELIAEIKELRKEVARQGEANVRLQQAVGTKLIEVNEKQARQIGNLDQTARLRSAA